MKQLIYTILIISISLNIIFFCLQKVKEGERELFKTSLKINYGYDFEKEFVKFKSIINSEKKVYFIHTWDMFSVSLFNEQAYLFKLDSLCNQYKNIEFLLVSNINTEHVLKFTESNKFRLNNIKIVNNMNSFLSSYCEKYDLKAFSSAKQIIFSNNGVVLLNREKSKLFSKENFVIDTSLINTLNKYNK